MKTDVYSWRVSRARKAALEEVARAERTSVANVLDRATDEWIRSRQLSAGADELEQARLRRAALRFVGAFHGSDPDRSHQARVRVRAKLARRHAG
jgi:hypothetical protein